LPSTDRSRKKLTKTKKPREFVVTLELMTPVMCEFVVEATTAAAAIEQALQQDWDDYEVVGPAGDGPTYCTDVREYVPAAPRSQRYKAHKIPKKYTAEAVNAAATSKE
jgi:hypothetical protein